MKHHWGFSKSPNILGKAEKKIKEKWSFKLFATWPVIENSKKIAKKFKKLKNTIWASFQAKTVREMLRKWENKNYRSDQFSPDP